MDYQPSDLNSVKLLICYLLYNLESGIDSEELYEISVDSGILNYFYYNEAIDELLVNDTIYSKAKNNGRFHFTLSEKGITYVKEFSKYVELSFRKRILNAALQYKAHKTQNVSVAVKYEPDDDGCFLLFSIADKKDKKPLVNMKLFTHSQTQAEIVAEQITEDPSAFYSDFIDFMLKKRIPGDSSDDSEDSTSD